MIAYIKGKVVNLGANFLVIEAGGIGYKIFCAKSAVIGREVQLHCFQYIREDKNDLYGFDKPEDLNIFEILLGVSGVGPKMAQNIVSQLGRNKVIGAISKNDPGVFKVISGVGNKVAAKIVVELKGKVFGSSDLTLPENDDTIEALLALGLRRDEVIPYLREIPDGLNKTEDKVRFVLKNVGKKK